MRYMGNVLKAFLPMDGKRGFICRDGNLLFRLRDWLIPYSTVPVITYPKGKPIAPYIYDVQ